jgi:uncharacterized protein (TIGR00255 family)
MINSMTAFTRQQQQDEQCQLQWEIRSVNHRYLDVSFRLPDALRDIEPKLRELAQQYLQRGKVECSLRYQPGSKAAVEVAVNESLVNQLKEAEQLIAQHLDKVEPSNSVDWLRWPGVLQTTDGELSEVKQKSLSLFEDSLKDFVSARQREGEKLVETLHSRLVKITDHLKIVEEALPEILQAQQDKLNQRFEEAKVSVDEERLAQEMVLYAQKIDVAEELDRLKTHVAETQRVLKKGGAIGRRLDFLLQEFNREANTLGSKSVSTVTSHVSIELKVLIEQMREQSQNIE